MSQLFRQPTPEPCYERSTLYYDIGSDLAVAAAFSAVVYRVREVSLCEQSPVIRNLLEGGRAVNPALGKFDASPLVLPYSKSDVELILEYCYNLPPSDVGFDGLCRLLQTSKELSMHQLRSRVITAASSHPSFPRDAASRIRLATTYDVKQWFYRAFEELLLKPLSALGQDDLDVIGADILHHLIKHCHKMEKRQVSNLAICPRFVLDWACRYRQGRCKQAWEEFWAETLAPAALAHDQGLCRDLLRQYSFTNESHGMCHGCMDRNIGLLSIDEKSDLMEVQAAVAALDVWRLDLKYEYDQMDEDDMEYEDEWDDDSEVDIADFGVDDDDSEDDDSEVLEDEREIFEDEDEMVEDEY